MSLNSFLNMSEEEMEASVKVWAEKHRAKELIKDVQIARIEKYIASIPEDKREEIFLNFLKWEKKYEDFQYDFRHMQTESRLFARFMSIIERGGKHMDYGKNDSMFLSAKYKYIGYTFELYCGQGSFWRIKKGKKFIFQQ